MKEISLLKEWIKESDQIVFFGGAGVSTESGISDFRSVNGLYHQEYDFPPETILSHSFYRYNPEEFFRFYQDKMINLLAKPNAAHLALAKLEEKNKVKAVITQNIDGLHQLAGSKNVIELHGSVHRNYCENCFAEFDAQYVLSAKGVVHCKECGGKVKPDVVLYEEGLNQRVVEKAIQHITKAKVLIIGGTSLTVYPAAGLIDYYKGKQLVLINQSETTKQVGADLIISEPIGEVFAKVVE